MATSDITFQNIEAANLTIRTTNIKGKEYAEVAQRVRAFRMLYPQGFITTEPIEIDTAAGTILMKATVGYHDSNGVDHVLGTGTSFEWKNDPKSMVNKTSYVENCETSAVGRALGMAGFGIDMAIASAEEVKYAIAHQEEHPDVVCQRCNKVITPHGKATVEQIVASTKKQFGKVMCWDCAHKTKEEQSAIENTKVSKEEQDQLPFPIEE